MKRALWLALAVVLAVQLRGYWPQVFGPSYTGGRVAKGAVDVTNSATLGRLFDKFDLDHDGILSQSEFATLLPDGREMLLDDNGDGFVDRTEFATSFLHVNNTGTNNDGVFARKDLHHIEELMNAGSVNRAAQESERATTKYPGSAETWSMHARVLERAGRIREATLAYDRALRIAPDDMELRGAWTWFSLGHGTAAQGKKALDELLQTMDDRLKRAANPGAREIETNRDEDFIVQLVNHFQDVTHDPKRALEVLDWGLKHVDRSGRLTTMALNAEVARGDGEQALAKARELGKDPQAAFAMTCFEARYLAQNHRTEEAEKLYREALKKPVRREDRMEALFQLYELLGMAGRLRDADQIIREQILPAATSFELATNFAKRLATIQSSDLAVHQVEAAASSISGNPEHWILVANMFAIRSERDASRAALLKALGQCGTKGELAQQVRKLLADLDAGH